MRALLALRVTSFYWTTKTRKCTSINCKKIEVKREITVAAINQMISYYVQSAILVFQISNAAFKWLKAARMYSNLSSIRHFCGESNIVFRIKTQFLHYNPNLIPSAACPLALEENTAFGIH